MKSYESPNQGIYLKTFKLTDIGELAVEGETKSLTKYLK